jgi:hypothetical protein
MSVKTPRTKFGRYHLTFVKSSYSAITYIHVFYNKQLVAIINTEYPHAFNIYSYPFIDITKANVQQFERFHGKCQAFVLPQGE